MQSLKIFTQPNEFDNAIDSLVKKYDINDALTLAEKNKHNLEQHNSYNIGSKHINYLLDSCEFQQAAKYCVRICKDDASWAEMISEFLKVNQIKILAPYIPIGKLKGQIQLKQGVYDTILCQLLSDCQDIESHTVLLNLVAIWPKHLYDVKQLADILLKKLINNENKVLQDVLAKVFCLQEKYDKSLAILFKLKQKDAFNIVRKYKIFELVSDKISELIEIDIVESIKLFIDYPNQFESEKVVDLLQSHDREKDLFVYLDNLVNKNHEICNTIRCRDYHNQLVYLYSKYAPHNLLSFLKSSDHYDMLDALRICQGDSFIRERIFVLARRGETTKALELIVNDLKDIPQAVDFCKQYADPDMWNNLVTFCMTKPIYLKGLIDNIGIDVKAVTPYDLIQRIDPTFEIPHLRDSIVSLLQQYRAQINIMETANRIIVPEEYTAMLQRDQHYKRGTTINYDTKCGRCKKKIIKPLLATGGPERNFLPASVNNACRDKDCACKCPNKTSLYEGKVCCKSKHIKTVNENNLNHSPPIDSIVVLLCQHVYHSACVSHKNPKCVVCPLIYY